MDDLQSCTSYGKAYFCPKITTLQRADSPSCLYALFHSNFKLASELCRFEIKQAQSAVMRLSDQYYKIFTPGGQTRSANVSCADSRSEPGSQLKEYTIVKIPDRCVLEVPGFLLLSKSEVYLDTTVKIHSFETQRQMVSQLNLSAVNNYLQLQSRYRRSPSLLLQKAIESPMFQKIEPVARVNYVWRHVSLVTGVLAILVLTLTGYCLYRYYQSHIKATPQPSPPPASQPLLPLQPSVQVNLAGNPDPAVIHDRQTPPPRYPEVPSPGNSPPVHYLPSQQYLRGLATPPSRLDKSFASSSSTMNQCPLRPPPFHDSHPPPPSTTITTHK